MKDAYWSCGRGKGIINNNTLLYDEADLGERKSKRNDSATLDGFLREYFAT